MSRKHLVVGHSHINALRQALLAGGHRAADGLPLEFVLLRQEEAVVLPTTPAQVPQPLADNWRSPAFREQLAVLCEGADHNFLLWQGGQFALRMTVAVGGEFDFVLPTEQNPPPTPLPLVPYAVVEQWADAVFNPMFDLVWEVLAPHAAAGRVSFLAPAPPLPTAAVKDRLLSSPGLMSVVEQMGIDLASTRLLGDSVRVKAWKVMLDAYERKARSCGCMLIRPPESVLDEAGRLGAAYWCDDVSHANAEYGRLYLGEIMRALGEPDGSVERERYAGRLS